MGLREHRNQLLTPPVEVLELQWSGRATTVARGQLGHISREDSLIVLEAPLYCALLESGETGTSSGPPIKSNRHVKIFTPLDEETSQSELQENTDTPAQPDGETTKEVVINGPKVLIGRTFLIPPDEDGNIL